MRLGRHVVRQLLGPAVLCAIAVGFVARVGWRALELEPLPVARVTRDSGAIVPAARSSDRVDVTPAVELDPFRSDRRRPLTRFPVPGDAPAPTEQPAPPSPSTVTLVGTVMSLDGSSFAMVAVVNSPPRVVRVGQTVGDLTLKRIEQGKAVFRSAAGKVVELTVPKAGQ